MCAIPPFLIRVYLLAALVVVLPLSGSDENVRTEIQHAIATPYRPEDPELDGFKLKFDLKLTNRSTNPISVPGAPVGEGHTTRVAVLGVQWRQPDGSWADLVQSSWVDDGSIRYETCTSVPSEGRADIVDIASGLLLFKKQILLLGQEPVLRFNLIMFCRRSDATVITRSSTTDGFRIRLAAR